MTDPVHPMNPERTPPMVFPCGAAYANGMPLAQWTENASRGRLRLRVYVLPTEPEGAHKSSPRLPDGTAPECLTACPDTTYRQVVSGRNDEGFYNKGASCSCKLMVAPDEPQEPEEDPGEPPSVRAGLLMALRGLYLAAHGAEPADITVGLDDQFFEGDEQHVRVEILWHDQRKTTPHSMGASDFKSAAVALAADMLDVIEEGADEEEDDDD